MKPSQLNSINDVLNTLDKIIFQSVAENDTGGYFAALYRQVTHEVKMGIGSNYFDDGPRMEKLDVVFAKRYIDAWYAWRNGKKVSQSWEAAFRFSKKQSPVVLQHLLMGMNAHINLDLGIAAAEISTPSTVDDLQEDFYRINKILSGLVNEVQHNLSGIWPPLKNILKKLGKWDNFLVDFSMEIARDGAWEFAKNYVNVSPDQKKQTEMKRDEIVAAKTALITQPGFLIKLLLQFIRWGEKGDVAKKIRQLQLQQK